MNMPSSYSSMVRCFRDAARIPESITDDEIYTVIKKESLWYSNSDPEEKLETLNFLRGQFYLGDLTEL